MGLRSLFVAESLFITNTDEGTLPSNGTGGRQDEIAQRIKVGIENYFSSLGTPTP